MNKGNHEYELIKGITFTCNWANSLTMLLLLLNSIKELLAVTFVVIVLIRPGSTTDYCSKKLCPAQNHIRCGNDGSFGKNCPKNAVEVPITDQLKSLILDKHNEVRRSISAGNYGLPTAKRMIEIVLVNV